MPKTPVSDNKTRATKGGLKYSIPAQQNKLKSNTQPQIQWTALANSKLPPKPAAHPSLTTNRYPNYIPQMRAQRIESSKQNEIHKRLNTQRQAEENALNRILLRKVHPVSFTTPPATAPPQIPLWSSQPNRPKNLAKQSTAPPPKELISLFKTENSFTDTGSPILQVELANANRSLPEFNQLNPQPQRRPATSVTPVSTNYKTDNFAEDYMKAKTRGRYFHRR